MKTTVKTLAAAALATLAVAPAASADGAADVPRITPPDIPFPADQIEHRVARHCSVAKGIYVQWNRNGCITLDAYITSDRDHEIWRDESGKVVAEMATVNGTVFSWIDRTNELVVVGGRPNKPSNLTFAAEAEMVRETVRRGWFAVAREDTRDGRPVLVLTETEQSPKDDGSTTVIVDKDTGQVLERSFATFNGQLSHQDTFVSVRQLPRTAENERLLTMTDRPDAKVRQAEGDDLVMASAARKAGLKKKTRSKIRRKALASRKKARR